MTPTFICHRCGKAGGLPYTIVKKGGTRIATLAGVMNTRPLHKECARARIARLDRKERDRRWPEGLIHRP